MSLQRSAALVGEAEARAAAALASASAAADKVSPPFCSHPFTMPIAQPP